MSIALFQMHIKASIWELHYLPSLTVLTQATHVLNGGWQCRLCLILCLFQFLCLCPCQWHIAVILSRGELVSTDMLQLATSFSQIPQLACFGDPKLSWSCLKIISKLSQSCPKVVLKLFQGPSQALEEGRQVWGWWGGRGRLVDRTRVAGG